LIQKTLINNYCHFTSSETNTADADTAEKFNIRNNTPNNTMFKSSINNSDIVQAQAVNFCLATVVLGGIIKHK